MIHVFKVGGGYKSPDFGDYSVECINDSQTGDYLDDGWFLSLEDAFAIEAKPEPKAIRKPKADADVNSKG
jgi:hypothetical protein